MKEKAMYISLRNSGFKDWSDTQRPNDDDNDGATPITVTEPPSDDHNAVKEPPLPSWAVPGTGNSF
jgi:hypothetical protein